MKKLTTHKLLVPQHKPMSIARRKCGDCTACCFTQAVVVLDKGPNRPCPHQCATGCSIYDKRPDECRALECLWLHGLGSAEDRPDKSGAVFFSADAPGHPRRVFAAQIRDDAFETNIRARVLAETLTSQGFNLEFRNPFSDYMAWLVHTTVHGIEE